MQHLPVRVRTVLLWTFGAAAGLMMITLFVTVFTNAFWRYTAGRSIVWGEEIAVYAMIFGVMFGMAKTYLEDRHVRFSIGLNLMPPTVRRQTLIGLDGLVAVTGVALAWSGFEFLSRRGGIESPGTGLPMWVFQSATVMGGALLAVSAVTQGWLRLTGQSIAEDTEV